jgi:NADH-quinone oxidoreductase subunit G
MPKLIVDGIEVEVPAGATVLQACEAAGKEVPRFCYHERLSIAGNCRMCLVEMEKAPKPIASCAFPAAEGMVIKTDTPLVEKARNGVMEFLLVNHPLDCPICDQGGECDLQDQAMAYGYGDGRFAENKRAVTEKHMGPLIKTIMTRCIHCTRCIRFASEVAGVDDMGALYRGENMQITTYLEKALASELSANVIDLCPVGALTSGPYAFVARPWELKKTESIDVMDAVGSAIRVDSRGSEVLRVLPRLNEDVNEEWISDKTRYIWDGLKTQRLDRPYVRVDGKLRPASWGEAFAAIASKVKASSPEKLAAIAGDLASVEEMFALKSLMTALGSSNIDCRQDGAALDPALGRSSYLFNATIEGIEDADAVLIIGSNPRLEAPVLNARIRKRMRMGPLPVGVIGQQADLTYPATYLGAGAETLADLAAGKHGFADVLKNAERPLIIVGQGALSRADGAAVLSAAAALARSVGAVGSDWNGFSVLHTAASRVGGLDIGFVPGEGGKDVAGILAGAEAGGIETVYLLAADEIDTDRLKNAFVIYQGHHGDRGAHVADVILPGAAYTEKEGLYVNTEGRVQLGKMAAFPPGEAREDWKILRALSERLGKTLPYNALIELRQKLVADYPVFARVEHAEAGAWGAFGVAGSIEDAAIAYPIQNFYMTDPVSRASATMAKCTEVFVLKNAGDEQGMTGTHG